MRLGTSPPLFYSSGEDWARQQAEIGCAAVNFPVGSNESIERIDEYKHAAEKYGLLIAEVGIWRNAIAPDPEERRRNTDFCVEQLRLADYIGARCAVNVAGALGPRWDGHYKANFSKEAFDITVASVREIIDRADVKHTYFTLEPMPWMIPSSPREYLRLMEAVDRDRFAVHLDAINMINSAERYFNTEGFIDECAELLGDRVKSCHIKDVRLAEEFTLRLEECAPGQGEFPLRYYAERFDRIDPDMPFILEHLSRDEDYHTYLKVLKEELNGLYKTL